MPMGRLVTRPVGQRTSALALTGAGWVAGAACTAAIVGTPFLRFGYHSPELHLVLDSVDACIAMLLAYLLVGRLRRTRHLQDLLLVLSLVMLAVVGLGLSFSAGHLPEAARSTIGVWMPASLRTGAALLIAWAALVPTTALRQRLVALGVTAPLVSVVAVVGLLWVLRDSLPIAVTASAPMPADRPVVEGHRVLLAGQAISAACFLFASVQFARQAHARMDEVLRWLGPACALLGFARVNYLLFPSLYSGWLYTGDVLRTAGYACLLLGAAREITRYWSAQADLAVVEDRRRLARELHDGVVQELSWIKSEARVLSRTWGDIDVAEPASGSSVQSILDASDRALDEARAAVDALGRDAAEPLGYAVHRAARDVAERYGGRVMVELDDSVAADHHQRHALVRITREAVANAVRHGGAACVRITLEATPTGGRLVVLDDGHGFDPDDSTDACGYGLMSMRARAQGLPGSFDLRSAPGDATRIEVTW